MAIKSSKGIFINSRFSYIRKTAAVLLFSLFLLSGDVFADQESNIIFIDDSESSIKSELIRITTKALDKISIPTSHVEVTNNKPALSSIRENDLIITIGTNSTKDILEKWPKGKILAVLISEASYKSLLEASNVSGDRISAIFIDQPANRQIQLINKITNGHPEIGILLGPTSSALLDNFITAANKSNNKIEHQPINDDEDLYHALDNIIDTSRILLAVPDPLIFNRRHIKSIFLKTYQKGIPIIGFSEGYTKAGAIASVHSNTAQISKQLTETIAEYKKTQKLPETKHPKYFSVSTNQKVARSLGLRLKSEEELKKFLEEQEK